jgi:type IV pilus assembly protein PilB
MTQTGPARVLGHYLLAAGVVQEAELQAAVEEQRRTRERIGDVLVRRGLAPEHVARALAASPAALCGITAPAGNVRHQLVDGDVAGCACCRSAAASGRAVAMAEPLDLNALDDLRFRTGRRIDAAVAVPAAWTPPSRSHHSGAMDNVMTRIGREAPAAAEQVAAGGSEGAELRRASEEQPIVALVELLLSRSIQLRASDIHVEATRVRARVDGVLRELLVLPVHMRGAVVSRIKILAGLDIAVKRRPQDGRGVVKVSGREFALRVSTLPAQGGEKVVLRLLESSGRAEPLAALGMAPDHHAQLLRLLERAMD